MKTVKHSNKISFLLILFLVPLAIALLQTPLDVINEYEEDIKEKIPKTSGFWVENFIHINRNWSITTSKVWCSGSGTYEDPYIIENVIINRGGYGNGILIENSSVYFIIKNCTVYNSGTIPDNGAGILFENVTNGKITLSNINNNYDGIFLKESLNNTIISNNLTSNEDYGIGIDSNSNNNSIIENIVKTNAIGISLSDSNKTIISKNTVFNTSESGITLSKSYFNEIIKNVINNNTYHGISSSQASYNQITENLIYNNSNYGIFLSSSHNNTLSKNKFHNNTRGISLSSSENNTITRNTLKNNTEGVVLQNVGCKNNYLFKNYLFGNKDAHGRDESSPDTNFWNNSYIGNYWDNHSTGDGDGDGIDDTEYTYIGGSAGSNDSLPIYGDPFFDGNPIHIDDTGVSGMKWAYASTREWCNGRGTYSDPYIIENVKIDAGGTGSGIFIENSKVYFIIINCMLYNSGFTDIDAGTMLKSVSNGTIINNNFSNNNRRGIILDNSDNNTVTGNIVNNNDYGIFLDISDNNTVSGNNVTNNYRGIYLYDSGNNTVSGNNATNNYLGILLDTSDDNTVSDNDAHNNTISYGILLDASDNNTVSGNTATNNHHGIFLLGSGNNTVSGNTANNNTDKGIYLNDSGNNTVSGNTATNNHRGIVLSDSNNNTVSGNTAHNNTDSGIYLDGSDNNTIAGNTATNNYYGVYLYISNYTIISGNIIEDNFRGVFLGDLVSHSQHNLFYNNYFIDNQVNAVDFGTWYTYWNNSVIGNFWSDYPYSDLDDDGVGDRPYDIHGVIDYLPIWDDGESVKPIITLNSPAEGTIFGATAPTFNISVYDINLNLGWYTINETVLTYFFSVLNGDNLIPINEIVWDTLSNGFVIIRFFVSDLIGNTNNLAVNITKDLPDEEPSEEDTTPPTIIINYPLNDTIFGINAPTFNLTIYDLNLNMSWYTINGNATKYFFSVVNGTNLIPLSQVVWETLAEGDIVLRFYVNDTAGNTNSLTVTINKDLPPDEPDTSGGGGIPFGDFYLLVTIMSIVLLIIIRRRKFIRK